MRYRKLGRSDVEVSELGLGCWTIGGPSWIDGRATGWAGVDEGEVRRAIHRALDEGVNHFDCADVYGNGRAERLLGDALAGAGAGARAVVATKVGHFAGTAAHAYEAAHIRQQCEQSLRNLRREVIDVYYFHHADFGPGERLLDGAVAQMRELQREGKVRLLGLSAHEPRDVLRVAPRVDPDVLQCEVNLAQDRCARPGSPVSRLVEERGLGLVASSPLLRGLLAGRDPPPDGFPEGDHRGHDRVFEEHNLQRLRAGLARVAGRFGGGPETLTRVALRYALALPSVSCVIPGFRSEEQVRRNLAAAAAEPLTDGDVAFLREAFRP